MINSQQGNTDIFFLYFLIMCGLIVSILTFGAIYITISGMVFGEIVPLAEIINYCPVLEKGGSE